MRLSPHIKWPDQLHLQLPLSNPKGIFEQHRSWWPLLWSTDCTQKILDYLPNLVGGKARSSLLEQRSFHNHGWMGAFRCGSRFPCQKILLVAQSTSRNYVTELELWSLWYQEKTLRRCQPLAEKGKKLKIWLSTSSAGISYRLHKRKYMNLYHEAQ